MALSPAEVREFLLRNKNIDLQAENRIEQFAQVHTPLHVTLGDETHDKTASFSSIIEEVRRLKKDNAILHARVTGLKNLRSFDIRTIESPNWDAIEQEVGQERQSNPKRNILVNGGFTNWNASANLPDGWTSANSPTISQVPGRPGIASDHVALRIASGGTAGTLSRTIFVGASTVYRMAGWIQVASGASATVTLTTNGASPVTMSFTVADTQIGAASWWSFPRQQADVLCIETPSDATTLTVTLTGFANKNVDFCDLQIGQGINRDPEVWTPAFEDTNSLTNISTLGTHWATPTTISADQNNYAPGTGSAYRLSASGATRTITGFSLSQTDGMDVQLLNVGNQLIVLSNESASSTAANRITTGTGADITLGTSVAARLRYDTTTSRWRLVG